MQLNTVVLPAPLGPISAVISPRPAVKEKLLMATSPPKRMLRCSTRRMGTRPGDSVAGFGAPAAGAAAGGRLGGGRARAGGPPGPRGTPLGRRGGGERGGGRRGRGWQ